MSTRSSELITPSFNQSSVSFSSNRRQLALKDIVQGFYAWRIWLLLAWQDIRLRYRRSQLGPFWLTISMAITIYTMGFLYGHLFKTDLKVYYPFLTAGMLTWNLISVLITDGANAFIESENYLKQMKLPYAIFLLKTVSRAFIIFFHNVVVIIPIMLIFHVKVNAATLLIIPALVLIAINGFSFGMLLAIFGARFRDVVQIIVSLMQIAFFVTPIMWNAQILAPKYQFFVMLNPFAQFVEILREPLLGTYPSTYAIIASVCITVFVVLFSFYIFSKVRHRIVYWL